MKRKRAALAGSFAQHLAIAVTVGSLAGCVDTAGDLSASGASARAPSSARGVRVALASVEGAPDAVATRFSQLVGAEAASRDITLTDAKAAQYLVRGYLTAYRADSGTAVAYVWDVFDQHRRRTQRVNDAIVVRGTAPDAWSNVDDRTLSSVASRSTDDLAAFLATTPEAGAGAPAVAGPPAE